MAALFISDVVVTSSADSGSQAVTVPSDADACVIGIGGWKSAGPFPPTTLTLGGAAFVSLQFANDDNFNMIQLSRLVAPATGSQTLAWDILGSGAITEGLVYILAFFKGVAAADPIIASGKSTLQNDITGLGSPVAGDMMVGFSASFDVAVTVTGSAQTSLSTPARFNSAFLRGAWKDGANTYDIAGGDGANCHAACVLRAAAAGVTGAAATSALAQVSAASGQAVVTGQGTTQALAQSSAAAGSVSAVGAAATSALAQSSAAIGAVDVAGQPLDVIGKLAGQRLAVSPEAASRNVVTALSGQREAQHALDAKRRASAQLGASRVGASEESGKAS